jgi:prepilin peptidase CpaA
MIHLLQAALAVLFPALVIAAALKDLTSYTIPNRISLALVAAFPVAALACGLPAGALGVHAAVGAAALVAGMAMFALGWIGGGDAKLFAAAALWLGWPAAATYAAWTGVAGGGLALALLALRSGYLRPYVVTGPAWFSRLAEPGENVPYGVAIAAGALAAFPASPWMAALSGL